MDITAAFPSKYVAAADLHGQDVNVIIANVVMEKVEGEADPLPMITFAGMSKGMILNKTNANTIAGLYGNETDRWIGQGITLFPTTTEFGGRTVSCIRVRSVAPAQSSATLDVPPPVAIAAAHAPVLNSSNPVTF